MKAAAVVGALLLTACTAPTAPVTAAPVPETSEAAALHTPHFPTRPRVLHETASRSRRPAGRPTALVGVRLSVTAYCPTGSVTASGVAPEPGMAAGNRWPFGTRLTVPTVGVVTVTDRIGHGSDLDVFMTSCAAARVFGRRSLLVTVQ